jgi:hypothetical protein
VAVPGRAVLHTTEIDEPQFGITTATAIVMAAQAVTLPIVTTEHVLHRARMTQHPACPEATSPTATHGGTPHARSGYVGG